MLKIIAKSLLSMVVIAVFGVIGLVAAEIRPFDVPDEAHRYGTRSGEGAASSEDAAYKLPAPPYTEQVLKNRTKKGTFVGYSSRLSIHGLKKFYTTKLPRVGWKQSEIVGSVTEKMRPDGELLSFRKGGHRCIIYFKPEAGFRTRVTVVHLNAGDLKPSKNREN